jgi:hypothetical protein
MNTGGLIHTTSGQYQESGITDIYPKPLNQVCARVVAVMSPAFPNFRFW